MKVLVVGASGAIGIPTVRVLRRKGHEVLGTTRSRERAGRIEALGARPAIVDAMDAGAVAAAVSEFRPEVVIDLLTALPKSGPLRPSHMRATNETRIKASGNVLAAAIQAGARRYLAESFFLVYGTGDLGPGPLVEDMNVPLQVKHPPLMEVIDAALVKERRALEAARSGHIESIVLRFGGFYGPGAGLESVVTGLRRRLLPVVDSSNATPWIQIDDAAAAVAAAVERGRSGAVYNVVDDQPSPMAELLRITARSVDAAQPLAVPGWLLQAFAPYVKALFIDSNIRPSNAKARLDLAWRPRFGSIQEGLPAVLSALLAGRFEVA
jgi:nucleoside-diphosphate-sugar epimerase